MGGHLLPLNYPAVFLTKKKTFRRGLTFLAMKRLSRGAVRYLGFFFLRRGRRQAFAFSKTFLLSTMVFFARVRGELMAFQVREGVLPRVGQYREQALREPRVLLALRSFHDGFLAVGIVWVCSRRGSTQAS